MKIGISSAGKDMSSRIDQRFGRCDYFLIVQTDDDSFEVFENVYKSLGSGAGIKAAAFLQSKDVKAILTGNCGPNAMNIFSQANIRVIAGQAGIIQDLIEQFKRGKLTTPAVSTVNEKAGLADAGSQGSSGCQGRGGGRGRGIAGGGRGMGGGGGAGMGGGRPLV